MIRVRAFCSLNGSLVDPGLSVLVKRDFACRFGSRMFELSIPMWCVVLMFVFIRLKVFFGNGHSWSLNYFVCSTGEAGYDEYLCLTRIFHHFGGQQILVRILYARITESAAVLTECTLDTGIVCEAYYERWR